MFSVFRGTSTTCNRLGYTIPACSRAILFANQISMFIRNQKTDELLMKLLLIGMTKPKIFLRCTNENCFDCPNRIE